MVKDSIRIAFGGSVSRGGETAIPHRSFQGLVPERKALHLEHAPLARVVRHKKGKIAGAIMRKRPCDPEATAIRDYRGAVLVQGCAHKIHAEPLV